MSYISCLLSLAIAGCDFPGKPNRANKPVSPNEIKDFSVLYRENCAGCHGADGKLGPAPPLNDPLFLAIIPDAVLRKVVTEGRAGTLMPAFAQEKGGTLTAAQVEIVAANLKKKWGLSEKPGVQPPPYEATTAGDPKRGEKAFARACASCHGPPAQAPHRKRRSTTRFSWRKSAIRHCAVCDHRPARLRVCRTLRQTRRHEFQAPERVEVTDLVAYMASAKGAQMKP